MSDIRLDCRRGDHLYDGYAEITTAHLRQIRDGIAALEAADKPAQPDAVTPAHIRGDGQRVHKLKVWPEFYHKIKTNEKRYEIRKADRDYQVGDLLDMSEWDPATAETTGKSLMRRVTYIMRDLAGLQPGYCLMSIEPIEAQPVAQPDASPSRLILNPHGPPTEGNGAGCKMVAQPDADEKEQEIVNLRARVAELEGKLDEAKRENADQIYRGNSVAYWHAKAVCYGDICLEVDRILNCPGVDIRDGAKKVVAERDKARADLAVERERADKLQAFKTFVHRRLDEMGVAEDPGGVHSAEGCRIGDRLDIMAQWKARAEPAGASALRCDGLDGQTEPLETP